MTNLTNLTNYCIDHKLDLKILTFNSLLFDKPTSTLKITDKKRAHEQIIFYANFSALADDREIELEKVANNALHEIRKYIDNNVTELKKVYKFW